jgi:hypothetical protein
MVDIYCHVATLQIVKKIGTLILIVSVFFITKGGQKNKTDNCDGAFIMCGTKQWQKQRKEWYSTQHSGSQDDAYDDDSNYIQKIEKER